MHGRASAGSVLWSLDKSKFIMGHFLVLWFKKTLLEFPCPRHLLSSFKELIKRAEINFLASQRKYNCLFPYSGGISVKGKHT